MGVGSRKSVVVAWILFGAGPSHAFLPPPACSTVSHRRDHVSARLSEIPRTSASGTFKLGPLRPRGSETVTDAVAPPSAPEAVKEDTDELQGDGKDAQIFDELLQRCTEATRAHHAADSPHTGSSEWAGFRTKPALLEAVTNTLARVRLRSRHSDGSAMAWSWLTLSPRPVRINLGSHNPRYGVYLTVLPAGKGSPPSHRPMYGCHVLSRVLTGEVEQVKSNSQRVIGRSTHSLETPVWSSYGGGARRLMNEGFQAAVVLEILLYDWSRGSGYSGSYAAPGTPQKPAPSQLHAEAGEIGAAGRIGNGEEGHEGGSDAVDPIVAMDACPCPPQALFGDGDVYEEEENDDEDGAGEGLTLVRRDGKAVVSGNQAGGKDGTGSQGGELSDLFTASELACDVGGLDEQLEDIVRRVLATRTLPAELRQALGVSHVRGLLLYGPPGCGKTLLARELSRRLGARPPKLVSGPEILDKWVGEAERKVRMLFVDAEIEHQRCVQMGEDPAGLPLNLVCFDEIDALCRSRGSLSGDTSGVRDSVVNQILSKMDGLVNLQNVLVVGMTNRKELLDDALLRPGRMEVCMPIPLPDERGRQQILTIHLKSAKDAGLVAPDVDTAALAQATDGFSGADLAGLVRSGTSFAIADWRRRYDEDVQQQEKSASHPAAGGVSGVSSEHQTRDNRVQGALGADKSPSKLNGADGNGVVLTITAEHFEKALEEVGENRTRGLRARERLGQLGGTLRRGIVRGLRMS